MVHGGTTSRYLIVEPDGDAAAIDQPVDPLGTVTLGNSGDALAIRRAEVAQYVLPVYATRGAYALMTGLSSRFPILPRNASPLFHDYQVDLRGYEVAPMFVDLAIGGDGELVNELAFELRGRILKPAVVTPLLVDLAAHFGFSVAGWSQDNIGLLVRVNTKTSLHSFLRTPEIEQRLREADLLAPGNHVVARPTVATTTTLADIIVSRLAEIAALYERYRAHLVQVARPPRAGVIVRSAWGATDAFHVLASGRRRFEVRCETGRYRRLSEADLRDRIRVLIGERRRDRDAFLITRLLLDVDGEGRIPSPGCNVVIGDRWSYTAPPHAQIFAHTKTNGTASITRSGAERYVQARRLSAEIGRILMDRGARNTIVGVDHMLTGRKEQALSHAVAGGPDEAEAVDAVAIAEINVRPTQSTMHLLTQLAMTKRVCGTANSDATWRELLDCYEGSGTERHYWSNDAVLAGSAALARVLADHDGLAGINGTLDGIYVMTPPTGGPGSAMGIGVVSTSRASLDRHIRRLEALLHGW